jgi:hypothetical protein
MLSPQALIKGLVGRALPTPNADSQSNDIGSRFGRYGENYVLSAIRKQHLLADEGSYFTASNAQTAITGPAATGFVATTPALVVYNGASAGGPRIYLDYLALTAGGTAFSNSTSNTGMFYALYIDTGNRYVSGGTALTAKNANMDSNNNSFASVVFGAPTASAASAAVRSLVGQRLFREPVSATALSLASMDEWTFNFGGVEGGPANSVGSSGVLQANIVHKVFNLPPVVIGPGQSALLYIWQISNSGATAGNFNRFIASHGSTRRTRQTLIRISSSLRRMATEQLSRPC